MTGEKHNLYFIALIPQSDVCEAITNFKKDFAVRFNSKKALKVIPHITLKAPFKLSAKEHDALIEWFNNLKFDIPAFTIELKKFGAFHNKRNPVIFVQPVMNLYLHSIQKEILNNFKLQYPKEFQNHDLHFNPHITIAYRDLDYESFTRAWKEYSVKAYNASFKVNTVYLLQHGATWQVIHKLHLLKTL
jgi:2'-5' RNA ligase